MKILIINGPNLNRLGEREPHLYGDLSLTQIQQLTEENLKPKSLSFAWHQSNLEGEIINQIQSISIQGYQGLIINPGGYAHTSVAIHDALKLLKVPKVEVHLTQLAAREEFRQTMLTAKAVDTVISGGGKWSYYLGVLALELLLKK